MLVPTELEILNMVMEAFIQSPNFDMYMLCFMFSGIFMFAFFGLQCEIICYVIDKVIDCVEWLFNKFKERDCND